MDSDLATFSDIPANYVLAAASCVVAAAVAAFVLLGGKKEAKPYARFPSPSTEMVSDRDGANFYVSYPTLICVSIVNK